MSGPESIPGRFQACIILCGLPASGKSTLAKRLESSLPGATPVQGIDVDEVRDVQYREIGFRGEFLPGEEARVRERKLATLAATLGAGMTVIDDDMNYFRSMRKEIVDACQQRQVHYAIIHVSTPLKRCLQWNASRARPVPGPVIRTIDGKFDKPGSRGYAWDVPLSSINLARMDVDRAVTTLMTVMTSLSMKLTAKESILDMLGGAPSVVGNPAFWNLALILDIVDNGYLVNDVEEWKARLRDGAGSILETFDLSARRAIADHVAASGSLSPSTLAAVKDYKQRARVTLKANPEQLLPVLDGLKRVLREPGDGS